MRYLAGKRLTTHEKNEKKNTVSLFAGFWLMTGWNAKIEIKQPLNINPGSGYQIG